MESVNIWQEITKLKNERRKVYFMWKNDIQNIRINYGAMTEDEFIEMCNKRHPNQITNPKQFLNHMKRWESSAEYKRLIFLLKEDDFATDLLDTYKSTKELAQTGDSQSIKNMLLLQKEIKKYRQSIDEYVEEVEESEEDDGLTI